MRPFFAIDPGPTESAWIYFDGESAFPSDLFGIDPNEHVLGVIESTRFRCDLIIEMIASYGMAVGQSVFETCVWIGRFEQNWVDLPFFDPTRQCYKMKRIEVKMHLCQNSRAKDSNINAALWDLYGGSQRAAKGTKKNPGPCYGFKEDLWAALAVGRTWFDTQDAQRAQTQRSSDLSRLTPQSPS